MAHGVLALMALIWLGVAGPAMAQAISMEARGSVLGARKPLFGGAGAAGIIPAKAEASASVLDMTDGATGAEASLFAGRAAASFFAPYVARDPGLSGIVSYRSGTGPVARLRDLIASAEAGRAQYDAVQHGARIKTPKPPTRMTIAEIYAWINATPGQPHAIGRYQMIPKTLRGLVRKAGLPPDTRFSPEVQDALADILLEEAGLTAFREGVMTRRAFMNNIAKIWAGLPNSSGKSHYHGYAGNKATMTWTYFDAQMKEIFG